jgi:hypothetical protein
MNKHSLSELPDKEFLDHANSIYDNCSQHSMTWNMDSSQMEDFKTFLTIANNAYKANSDPSSRNRITSMEKKRAFADLKHRLSIFVNYIESNLNIPDEALAYMKLRPRVQTGRQPIPAPTEAPIVEVVQQHDEVRYTSPARNSDSPQRAYSSNHTTALNSAGSLKTKQTCT